MLRTLLAIVAGLITAMLVIFGVEAAGMLLFPPPAGMPLDTEADLARLVAMSSPAAKAWLVFGWALGSFVGAWVAARIGRQHRRIAASAVALFIVAGTVMNAMVIAHPLWMNLLGILLPVPLALLASRLVGPRVTPGNP
ncbi:hypothetical protein CSC74_15850 [Pseudoxanthomonas yeongjuensis]|uniref:hypothetical protein n=1 Tax=Pseudoxanthomonas yeongjuensis TaxID=377616 RepID=UPI0013920B69|nr:hypothetical protein [Pseudoxanthomonas yeongjuensis]KAF1714406.1 hypothetical protein CSC74_15850 [Pseudoxanthomonas yeongjuensis]